MIKKSQENIKKIEITKIDDLPLTFQEKLNYAYGVSYAKKEIIKNEDKSNPPNIDEEYLVPAPRILSELENFDINKAKKNYRIVKEELYLNE